ncbi:ketose-bisphosphate aldolase [Desulfovibrio sp.]|uniref:class II fructose-bisphosphate aldolase n=1 Tax=Desulfovibrio sp. TaxID=885 RepID=UPI0023BCD9D9|nr:ketose-bisphosphate aldolase [Desulfovibrio sp.]MDE7241198.1 ketose-bisphosphate aldolase [Desulfovibrio sp.]
MLVSSREMLAEAAHGKYAIGQFNINNLEWIRAILNAAQAEDAPVILGVTESACAYMGGLQTVKAMACGMAASLGVTVPVALHLDHAGYEMCLMAIGAGFTSVMFDGSKMPFAENLRLCRRLARACGENGVALEAELGSPAGEEDGISGSGERADPAQCGELAQTGLTALAASIGNIHGEYPPDWQGLDLGLLAKIKSAVAGLPLVLHGGSGIPEAMVKTAIENGIAKINVNTECQIAFAHALQEYFAAGRHKAPKGYNLQKLLRPGLAAIEEVVRKKIRFFGSAHRC